MGFPQGAGKAYGRSSWAPSSTINMSVCQAKYPDVCTAEEIEALFNPERAIDLYFDVVLKAPEWPTRDYSIKSLAKYLGFIWRNTYPSGAGSIEWFHRWVESGDQEIKQRILDYNEDDCRATRVLIDGIRRLRVRSSPEPKVKS